VISDLIGSVGIGPVEPLIGFLVVGIGGAIASGYYGVWWLIVPCLVAAGLAGTSLFRRARKVYEEGSWEPS
jgi:hypothetical protein